MVLATACNSPRLSWIKSKTLKSVHKTGFLKLYGNFENKTLYHSYDVTTLSSSRPIQTYKYRILVVLQAGVEEELTQEFNTRMCIYPIPNTNCPNAVFNL
jgi:hypothetical protein